MQNVRRRSLLAAFALAASLCVAAAAESFPPVTDAERALKAVPGDPKAPAVVLSREAELRMMGYGIGSNVSSSLTVHSRVKILTEQGKSQGEMTIPHSLYDRLLSVKGRTVLPDGRVLPLGSEGKFVRRTSQREKRYVTSLAFPGVEVGAILDLSYEIRFDTFLFLQPWYFSDELPVLHSEIVYDVPKGLAIQGGSSDPFKVGVQTAQEATLAGTQVRVWAENLPAVPDEPFGPPFADLATQVLILPLTLDTGVERIPLLESWANVCKYTEEDYADARRKDGGVAEAARRITSAEKDAAARVRALYRFVRDEIATDDDEGIFLNEGSSLEKTLRQKHGDSAEKALLLQALLRETKTAARLAWAGDRRRGAVDPNLANPLWFDRVLVVVELDGKRVFLDPSDRDLGFGQLAPWYEGTPAVLPDKKKPETVTLPEEPFDRNGRRAVIDLALDDSGRLAGTGTLALTGHHAWARARAEDWKEWLTGQLKDFQVADVKVEEALDDPGGRRVQVAWSLRQRDEDVLGDEVSFAPSRPLGPAAQPFVQPVALRRSPVLFSFADRDEVEVRLRWPAGWAVDARPETVRQMSAVGDLDLSVESDDNGRTLVYRRRLDMKRKQLATVPDLNAVQKLFAAVEKSDAQTLDLVRR
jgi:transglutaminase-like putative cysteine protease